MNLTFGNAASNTWKSLKVQHIAAAAGIALAVSAAIGIVSWKSQTPAPEAVSSRSSWTAVAQPASPRVVFYLAASEEQAAMQRDALRLAAIEASSSGMPDSGVRALVLVPASAEDVVALLAAVANAGQEDTSGTQYEIVDLRGR
jgi:hypothetical protein